MQMSYVVVGVAVAAADVNTLLNFTYLHSYQQQAGTWCRKLLNVYFIYLHLRDLNFFTVFLLFFGRYVK